MTQDPTFVPSQTEITRMIGLVGGPPQSIYIHASAVDQLHAVIEATGHAVPRAVAELVHVLRELDVRIGAMASLAPAGTKVNRTTLAVPMTPDEYGLLRDVYDRLPASSNHTTARMHGHSTWLGKIMRELDERYGAAQMALVQGGAPPTVRAITATY